MKFIGKYEIIGLLGRGGMGKIFKVRLPVIGKIAALKLLAPSSFLTDLLGMDKIESLFFSEAVAMTKIRHNNILEIWDFDNSNGKYFYTMDYYCNSLGSMIGETYKAEMPSRIIPVGKAFHYVHQTLSGLACLHHGGITHRDIKPFNILITDQDNVKICDFGLSKLRNEVLKYPENLKIGSPFYAAPEQEDDPEHVDFRADVYSAGVMLYRMLTGILPDKTRVMPSTINPDLDENWDQFILKAISNDPEKRFISARQMQSDLEFLQNEWISKKERICSLPPNKPKTKKQNRESLPSVKPRTAQVKTSPRHAREVFNLDKLWRPEEYISNQFVIGNNKTISDKATGLIWQQSGSDYPVTWKMATAYIHELNRLKHSGISDWRLPTIDELMSLLTPVRHGSDLCIEPVFDKRQKWLWSIDRSSYVAAWYVSVELGFVSWQDMTGYYYVKGVCDNFTGKK